MFSRLLKGVAAVALAIGAVASVITLWHAGQRTPPLVLAGMMAWVASPFALLAFGFVTSRFWPLPNCILLYVLTLVLAVLTPVIYANNDALRPAGRPYAALFVALPPICWIMIVAVLVLGAVNTRRQVIQDPHSR